MFPHPARRTTLCILPLVLALVAPAALAPAARADDAASAPVTGERGELLRALDAARSELLDLAQAMPEDKYDWRPGKGVRSVAEVYLHVAQGNYNLPHLAGVEIPADVDVKHLADVNPGKAQVIAILTRSFDHAEAAIRNLTDADLEKPAKIFKRDGTAGEAFFITVTHAHEHLGQSIAYARVNGVVPPWTAKAEAAAAAKAADKDKPKEAAATGDKP